MRRVYRGRETSRWASDGSDGRATGVRHWSSTPCSSASSRWSASAALAVLGGRADAKLNGARTGPPSSTTLQHQHHRRPLPRPEKAEDEKRAEEEKAAARTRSRPPRTNEK